MRNAALPIDWGLVATPFSTTRYRVCPPGGGGICIYIYIYARLSVSFVCKRAPIAVSRDWCWWWEECEGTNLGTVRMEIPCRCYSHLHSRLSIQTPLSLPFFLYLFLSSATFLPLVPFYFPRFLVFVFFPLFLYYRRLEPVDGWRVVWR